MKNYWMSFCFALCLLPSGCITRLASTVAPGAELRALGKVFVVHFDPDKRYLNTIIADQLTLMGHPAATGERNEIPKDVDTLVTYKDNWQWDMANYMIRITIQFRNGRNETLLISGESYRTSLARRSPEVMIKETLTKMLDELEKKEPIPK
ncbi:MAG: hypothetical protein A3K19_22735 [Lentisphaerae bacterium RIFOXYB12_FULL_65_16]|nr:MAG: hypothetical protein A3K18_17020 [Lentisphaerae bacterium RIFOXYA12_64_32]OGV90028.1 MAG: hypothetical protein A3K19_22735 [Lentisphaerae bacterium RIFOXYB12_FULL_65_16]